MRRFTPLLFLLAFNVYSSFLPGDAFKAFFWTQNEPDSLKYGCYGYILIDSVTSLPEEDIYIASFWLTYEWWFLRFNGAYTKVEIKIRKSKHESISRCPDHFAPVEWFSSFKLYDTTDSIRFYFPLMPLPSEYGRYDYFTIDVDSLLDLECYGGGDSIFVGTFVHKEPDDRGSINILGRNAIIVELTKANPLRIKSVRCQGKYDSLLSLYLKFDLDTLEKDADWYGVDIIEKLSNVPKIAFNSIEILGKKPYLVGSQKNISWGLKNKEEVDSCFVSVAYDSMEWVPIGTTVDDTIMPWTISTKASQATILKVLAYGKHGERIYTTLDSLDFYRFELRALQLIED